MDSFDFKTAKWCFATRRIDPNLARGLCHDLSMTMPGDLILGRVMSIGNHRRIQLPTGRPSMLYAGDLVVLPCGARYAPDQFEGLAELDTAGSDMLAGGGCIGRMVQRNERIKPPTRIQPLGRITSQNGMVLNTGDFALSAHATPAKIPVICVVGTSMNSGKTTATAALAHGLKQAGWKTAVLKGTGTGAFGDYNAYVDAGASYVADFTDAGMVTTYLEPLPRIIAGIDTLLGEAETRGCDIAVMELADGVFQQETAALLADPEARTRFSKYLFACADAVAAAGGVAELARNGIRPIALTGMLSCSPMAVDEAQAATGIQVLTKGQLLDPAYANTLAARTGVRRAPQAA
ncbi:DUF1611 domain-containing protein [Ruegeria sp. 2205SS24-7]|uniref:DUF1611 domain-containing protein n=1 Tax=Ruegeria discodermiae TaxID=3064389 RepID=UPI0027412971|nr:DUF1611 domain-containing protein [Ruegeria sp. 2205SS24-7]MDP5217298.1 DUF1611 domain-containing protein [Ruegeria sp. 2205SS24-7]